MWFDHWIEDEEEVGPFSHWSEDNGIEASDRCCTTCAKQFFCDITLEDDNDDCDEWKEDKIKR